MKKPYDFFIDESCHLEADRLPVMCIGYVKIANEDYHILAKELKSLFAKHSFNKELKWNKFSGVRLEFYKALIDFFFEKDIFFRCVLVKYKHRLNHEDFNQGSHDNFYYKMVYFLLMHSDGEKSSHRVFLDIKDTRGREKLRKIREIFENKYHGQSPFKSFQHLHSHDNIFFQIADFFIGAITYSNRIGQDIKEPEKNKLEFIKYLEYKSGFHLDEGTVPWEHKFNIFNQQPKMRM